MLSEARPVADPVSDERTAEKIAGETDVAGAERARLDEHDRSLRPSGTRPEDLCTAPRTAIFRFVEWGWGLCYVGHVGAVPLTEPRGGSKRRRGFSFG